MFKDCGLMNFRYLKRITAFQLVLFGLATLSICLHGPCGDDSVFFTNSESAEVQSAIDCHSCGDCDDHGGEADSHLCPCLSHVPAILAVVHTTPSQNIIEILRDNKPEMLPMGLLNRVERPPKHA